MRGLMWMGWVAGSSVALCGCANKLDAMIAQYEMLKDSGATNARLCEQSEKISQAYFDSADREGFLKWDRQRQTDCRPEIKKPQTGVISGSLTFPSDYLPEDMQVCAQNLESDKVDCNSVRTGDRYRLELPPGRYIVWSQTKDAPDQRAFYSVAVPCGLAVHCKDHQPLRVVVKAGSEVDRIDPGDWYASNK